MFYVDKNIGFVASHNGKSDKLFRTVDGGNSWNLYCDGIPSYISNMYFFNQDSGYFMSINSLSKIKNGVVKNIRNFMDHQIRMIYFEDNKTGYPIHEGGLVQKTKNGEFTWDYVHSIEYSIGLDIQDFQYINNKTAYILPKDKKVLYKILDENVSYSWSPENSLNDPNILNPVASPNATTTLYSPCYISIGINRIRFC